MKTKDLVLQLWELHKKGHTNIKCAIDEEWNAIGNVDLAINGENKDIVLFPIETECEY